MSTALLQDRGTSDTLAFNDSPHEKQTNSLPHLPYRRLSVNIGQRALQCKLPGPCCEFLSYWSKWTIQKVKDAVLPTTEAACTSVQFGT